MPARANAPASDLLDDFGHHAGADGRAELALGTSTIRLDERSELAILSAALRATEHQRDEWYACAAGRQARIEALLEEVSDLHAQYSEALGADLDAELCALFDEEGGQS
mgnify:CR=1 FL=1